MKMRCPHCKQVFEDAKESRCPHCGKWVLITREQRDGVKPPRRGGKTFRARREQLVGRTPPPGSLFMIPMLLFTNRTLARIFFWTLVVITIIGARLMLIKVNENPAVLSSGKLDRTKRELRVIRTALEWFRSDCRRYPTTEEGLVALGRNPGIDGWHGMYIDLLCPDVWGQAYYYAYSNDTVILYSYGQDMKQGTADDVQAPDPDWKTLIENGCITVSNLPRQASPPGP